MACAASKIIWHTLTLDIRSCARGGDEKQSSIELCEHHYSKSDTDSKNRCWEAKNVGKRRSKEFIVS